VFGFWYSCCSLPHYPTESLGQCRHADIGSARVGRLGRDAFCNMRCSVQRLASSCGTGSAPTSSQLLPYLALWSQCLCEKHATATCATCYTCATSQQATSDKLYYVNLDELPCVLCLSAACLCCVCCWSDRRRAGWQEGRGEGTPPLAESSERSAQGGPLLLAASPPFRSMAGRGVLGVLGESGGGSKTGDWGMAW